MKIFLVVIFHGFILCESTNQKRELLQFISVSILIAFYIFRLFRKRDSQSCQNSQVSKMQMNGRSLTTVNDGLMTMSTSDVSVNLERSHKRL